MTSYWHGQGFCMYRVDDLGSFYWLEGHWRISGASIDNLQYTIGLDRVTALYAILHTRQAHLI